MQGSDHALRYLSIHENNFIRYFRGHTDRVTSLGICPKSDLVMSTSQVISWHNCVIARLAKLQ